MLTTIEGLWGLPVEAREQVEAIRDATTLAALVVAGLHLALALASWVVQEELSRRGRQLIARPECPKCGRTLESKGLAPRTVQTIIGRRRVWRCPIRCQIGPIAPYDDE